jgi:hypothetical protein
MYAGSWFMALEKSADKTRQCVKIIFPSSNFHIESEGMLVRGIKGIKKLMENLLLCLYIIHS